MRLRFPWDNAVALRELRGKGRASRLLILMVVTWAILTAAVGGYGYLMTRYGSDIVGTIGSSVRQGMLPAGSGPGIILFGGIAILMFGVAMYAPPALAATVISREREQQSLGLLLISRLTRGELLWGKLLGSTLPVLLALTCAFPFLMLCSAFGGVRLDLILFVYAKSMITALSTAAIGLACSCIVKSTAGAVIASYGTLFVLAWGVRVMIQQFVVMMWAMTSIAVGGSSSTPNLFLLFLSTSLADVFTMAALGGIAFIVAWAAFRRLSEE